MECFSWEPLRTGISYHRVALVGNFHLEGLGSFSPFPRLYEAETQIVALRILVPLDQ